ncbi:MAG: tRNA methyltransferase [Holosporales bacterium]|jgi:tRNA (cytidine/uridine-2'-O-)-methyltransferase|nr:tRNA methyltransferase [Holosporales bacterium]
MILALYQTEIAQNAGTMLRLGACLGVVVDVIEPLGFPWNDARMRRAGMDYIDLANVRRFSSFEEFWERRVLKGSPNQLGDKLSHRVVLLDTHAEMPYTDLAYRPSDIIMVGRESCGVPAYVREACHVCVRIPMVDGTRSLNVAVSAGIGLSEGLRQVNAQNGRDQV